MFTVEDVNSVLMSECVNGYYELDTGLIDTSSYGFCTYDFVKVLKSGNNWSFTVDNELWTGGFYIRKSNGDYVSLGSNDYSFSAGALNITTSLSGFVLVLYLSSFKSGFNLQYLNCRLESLYSVVDTVSVGVSDFTSLNGTAISSSDISVSDTVVTCRSNTFYKDIVELNTIPLISVANESSLIAGSPTQTVVLSSSEDITGVTVQYGNVSEYVEFEEDTGSFDVDLSEHLTTDDFAFKCIVEGVVFNLTAPVEIIGVNNASTLQQALASKIAIIRLISSKTTTPVPVFDVDYDVTILCDNKYLSGTYKISEGVNFVLDSYKHEAGVTLFDIGENVNVTFENCDFDFSNISTNPTLIFANEDIEDTNSKLVIDNCQFMRASAPVILFDGELEIIDSAFEYPRISSGNTSIFEPSFIHMTGGELKITNTEFKTMNKNGSAVSLSGYNLASLLLSEDTTFNGVPATELSKGNPSLNQYNITSTVNVNYANGGETVHLTDGFYVAVEDKKIKNIKED